MANPQQNRWREPETIFDEDIERAILIATIYDAAVRPTTIRPTDFHRASHREIWREVCALVDAGDSPDQLILGARLRARGEHDAAEVALGLSSWASEDYLTAIGGWVAELLALAERRTSDALGRALVEYAHDSHSATARANIARYRQRLDDIQRRMRGESAEGNSADVEPALLGVSLADIEVDEIHWLWSGRIALGKITMIDGDPGLGKSLVTCDLGARVTMGHVMPDGTLGLDGPAYVVIVCGEDGLADTVKPRFLAAGASPEALERVRAINQVPEQHEDGTTSERMLSLLADLPALEATISKLGARLLIIDPITAYLGSGTDMYKDSDLRRVLTPLAQMAERTGVAVLAVRHLNKSTNTPALHRGLGGVGFIGVARLGLLFAPNPDNDGEVLVSRHKGNIGAPPPTLAYRIIQVGEAENMPRIVWQDGERQLSAGDALAAQTGAAADPETRSATSVAVEWLIVFLADGPRPAKAAKENAIEAGIITDEKHDKPLRSARERICLTPYKPGMSDGWWWELDPEKVPSSKEKGIFGEHEGTSPDFKATSTKMPTPDASGHLRTEQPSKMPAPDGNGHLHADAVEFSDGDTSEDQTPPKMPTTSEEGTFVIADEVEDESHVPTAWTIVLPREQVDPCRYESHKPNWRTRPDGSTWCNLCHPRAGALGRVDTRRVSDEHPSSSD